MGWGRGGGHSSVPAPERRRGAGRRGRLDAGPCGPVAGAEGEAGRVCGSSRGLRGRHRTWPAVGVLDSRRQGLPREGQCRVVSRRMDEGLRVPTFLFPPQPSVPRPKPTSGPAPEPPCRDPCHHAALASLPVPHDPMSSALPCPVVPRSGSPGPADQRLRSPRPLPAWPVGRRTRRAGRAGRAPCRSPPQCAQSGTSQTQPRAASFKTVTLQEAGLGLLSPASLVPAQVRGALSDRGASTRSPGEPGRHRPAYLPDR